MRGEVRVNQKRPDFPFSICNFSFFDLLADAGEKGRELDGMKNGK